MLSGGTERGFLDDALGGGGEERDGRKWCYAEEKRRRLLGSRWSSRVGCSQWVNVMLTSRTWGPRVVGGEPAVLLHGDTMDGYGVINGSYSPVVN